MTRLVHAELLKLRTTRAVPAALLGMLAVTTGTVAYALLSAGTKTWPSLGTTESTQAILSAPRLSSTFMLVLGTVVMTGEFRHRTAASTFLVSPRRGRVVAAKLAAMGLVAAGYALVAFAAALAVALPWLTATKVPLDVFNRELGLIAVGAVLGPPLFALLGAGFGALTRVQLAAALIPLVWLQVVEGLIDRFFPGMFRWLLSGASAALSRAPLIPPRPQWPGGLLLLAYALALAAVGNWFVVRRDITG